MLSKRNLFVFAMTAALLTVALLLSACSGSAAPAGQEAPAEPENVEAPAPPPSAEVDVTEVETDTGEIAVDQEDELMVEEEETDTGELGVDQDEDLRAFPETDTGEVTTDQDEDLRAFPETDTGEVTTDQDEDLRAFPETDAGDAPSTPVLVKLYMSQPPLVGEEAELVMEITTYADAPEINAQIELPPGVELVSGQTTWQGSLKEGESTEFSAVIVFTKPGEYSITATALAPINSDMIYGDDDAIFLTIGEESSHFGLESGDNPQLEVGTEP